MKTVFLEPTDVLFFRDAIPMSAGQGRGAGARMPFPSTLHEALRASLLTARSASACTKPAPHLLPSGKQLTGRDGKKVATFEFQSLRSVGPFAWQKDRGLLLPVPLDIAFDEKHERLARLKLWRDESVKSGEPTSPEHFLPLCLPVAVTPPDKHAQLHGWWTLRQWESYLRGLADDSNDLFGPVPQTDLWEAEHRIGVEIEPETFASRSGQLYAGTYLRVTPSTCFAAQVGLQNPVNGEAESLDQLDWLLLGGEQRLARIYHNGFDDPFAKLPPQPKPAGDGPCLLKWVLITPAVFAHGSLPGWCVDTKKDRASGMFPTGRVCLDLPGRALLFSWCLGKSLTVSGWDVVEQRAKPTMLAVPAGSVYYFLCENRETASSLAGKLHWRPRSDYYGEKGCGYGLVSFDVAMHPISVSLEALPKELFR